MCVWKASAPAVAEAIYGKGHVVEEHFDGCSYFVDSADGKALAKAARKVEAMGRQREAGAPPPA